MGIMEIFGAKNGVSEPKTTVQSPQVAYVATLLSESLRRVAAGEHGERFHVESGDVPAAGAFTPEEAARMKSYQRITIRYGTAPFSDQSPRPYDQWATIRLSGNKYELCLSGDSPKGLTYEKPIGEFTSADALMEAVMDWASNPPSSPSQAYQSRPPTGP